MSQEQTQSKSNWFSELIGQVEAMDPSTFPPRGSVENGDTKIGELRDPFVKRLHALWQYYAEEAALLKVRLLRREDDEQLFAEWNRAHTYEDALREMFWLGVRQECNIWNAKAIGVRKSWIVVETDPKQTVARQIMRGLLGGE